MSQLKEIREHIVVDIKEVVEGNKETILEAYEKVMKFEGIARREGLLALDCEAQFLPKDMPLCNVITEMVDLIVSGTEPDTIEELMTIKFFVKHDYTKVEALLYYLYVRGLLMIQAATPPILIKAFFGAFLPEELPVLDDRKKRSAAERQDRLTKAIDALTEQEKELLAVMNKQLMQLSESEWEVIVSEGGYYGFERLLPYLEEATKALVKKYMNDYRYYVIMNEARVISKEELIELQQELGEMVVRVQNQEPQKSILAPLLEYSDKEMEELLRHTSIDIIERALKGEHDSIKECFFNHISYRLKEMIEEDMICIGPVRVSEILTAQKEIMQIAGKISSNKGICFS